MSHEKVVIVGQGYVGLPIAMRAVEVGFDVVGLDIDKSRMDMLARGHSYIEDVSDGALGAALATGRYQPTTDEADVTGFNYAIITVPTPLKESLPDLTFIEDASEMLGRHLTRGATVVLESTTHPGTTEELMVPILERVSGLRGGTDFHAGYSPERIDPGNQQFNFVNTPKVIAGIDDRSSGKVESLYSQLVDNVVPVSTPREAELTKLLENTFRHVNIALVNELAVYARELGVDIWEAIDAASTKPFGFMRFTPGPGVGGHCLPVDPSYLSWQVRKTLGKSFRFVELANDVNEHMPDYVVQRVTLSLNARRLSVRGSKLLILGISYKKNTGDVRESPAARVAEILNALGADLFVVDPHLAADRLPGYVQAGTLTAELLGEMDMAILLTDHDAFDYDLIARSGVAVFDTRRRIAGPAVESL